MTPYYSDPWLTVFHGDATAVLATLPAESVHCVVTSPPYWGLRDYGTPGQLGLEATPEAYVAAMVAVFREVRRVLRKDGTVWLNLGDSYAGSGGYSPDAPSNQPDAARQRGAPGAQISGARIAGIRAVSGLKPKDLVGIPWRVAFALQADGWYLRSDIVWAKLNPMPESVTDRPTKAHEYVFLLSRSPRYYFDGEAVRRPISPYNEGRVSVAPHGAHVMDEGHRKNEIREYDEIKGANIRSVWQIATQPYPGAHFAVFPEALVEPCVKAGTSERGVCPECGAPWQRIVERVIENRIARVGHVNRDRNDSGASVNADRTFTTTGWRPSCGHDAEPVPGVVLDMFAGSGTVGLVAQRLSRRAVLIDLSMDYLDQLMDRNRDIPLGLGA